MAVVEQHSKYLDMTEARALTDQVNGDIEALGRNLLRLYEGQAHLALDYASWAEYCAEEFGMTTVLHNEPGSFTN
jgi:hypothetical protein